MGTDDDEAVTRPSPPWRPNPDLIDHHGRNKRAIERGRKKVREILELGYFPDDPKWLRS